MTLNPQVSKIIMTYSRSRSVAVCRNVMAVSVKRVKFTFYAEKNYTQVVLVIFSNFGVTHC